MRKRKWLSFLLAVMMLVSATPFSSVTAGAADGTVEVSTWDELKRALEYTTNCSVVKVVKDIETESLNGHTGLHQNNIIFMTMEMDKVLDLNGHTVNAYVKYYSEVGQSGNQPFSVNYYFNESNVDTLITMELQYNLMLETNGVKKQVMTGYKGAKLAQWVDRAQAIDTVYLNISQPLV